MAWTYEQNTGRLLTPAGRLLAIGYSGLGNGKNNPELDTHPGVGPIPRTTWTIGQAVSNTHMGPITMPLTPTDPHQTHGRSGFWIHGDLPDRLQDASHGCIVLPRYARERLSESRDRTLIVILAHPDDDA